MNDALASEWSVFLAVGQQKYGSQVSSMQSFGRVLTKLSAKRTVKADHHQVHEESIRLYKSDLAAMVEQLEDVFSPPVAADPQGSQSPRPSNTYPIHSPSSAPSSPISSRRSSTGPTSWDRYVHIEDIIGQGAGKWVVKFRYPREGASASFGELKKAWDDASYPLFEKLAHAAVADRIPVSDCLMGCSWAYINGRRRLEIWTKADPITALNAGTTNTTTSNNSQPSIIPESARTVLTGAPTFESTKLPLVRRQELKEQYCEALRQIMHLTAEQTAFIQISFKPYQDLLRSKLHRDRVHLKAKQLKLVTWPNWETEEHARVKKRLSKDRRHGKQGMGIDRQASAPAQGVDTHSISQIVQVGGGFEEPNEVLDRVPSKEPSELHEPFYSPPHESHHSNPLRHISFEPDPLRMKAMRKASFSKPDYSLVRHCNQCGYTHLIYPHLGGGVCEEMPQVMDKDSMDSDEEDDGLRTPPPPALKPSLRATNSGSSNSKRNSLRVSLPPQQQGLGFHSDSDDDPFTTEDVHSDASTRAPNASSPPPPPLRVLSLSDLPDSPRGSDVFEPVRLSFTKQKTHRTSSRCEYCISARHNRRLRERDGSAVGEDPVVGVGGSRSLPAPESDLYSPPQMGQGGMKPSASMPMLVAKCTCSNSARSTSPNRRSPPRGLSKLLGTGPPSMLSPILEASHRPIFRG